MDKNELLDAMKNKETSITIEEIVSGESEYLELKREVPKKGEAYMKMVAVDEL